jgi:hypothetical protein
MTMADDSPRQRIDSGAQPILSVHSDKAEGGPSWARREAYVSLSPSSRRLWLIVGAAKKGRDEAQMSPKTSLNADG